VVILHWFIVCNKHWYKFIQMKIGRYLTLAECIKSDTAIRKGIDNTPQGNEVQAMIKVCAWVYDDLCEYFNCKIPITSFYRSEQLNRAIGGSASSQHCKGEAIDLDCDTLTSGLTNKIIFNYIKNNLTFDQLIYEFGSDNNPDWVHCSIAYEGQQRMQVLRATKIKSKTIYIPWVNSN
jgi:zinc D-Ala-D-Ala carboxypeptidase